MSPNPLFHNTRVLLFCCVNTPDASHPSIESPGLSLATPTRSLGSVAQVGIVLALSPAVDWEPWLTAKVAGVAPKRKVRASKLESYAALILSQQASCE